MPSHTKSERKKKAGKKLSKFPKSVTKMLPARKRKKK